MRKGHIVTITCGISYWCYQLQVILINVFDWLDKKNHTFHISSVISVTDYTCHAIRIEGENYILLTICKIMLMGSQTLQPIGIEGKTRLDPKIMPSKFKPYMSHQY